MAALTNPLSPSPSPEPGQRTERIQTESPTDTTASTPTPTATSTQVKLKQFSYTPAWDLLLLKAVATSGAHIALHGQTTTKYEEASKLLIAAVPPRSLERQKPGRVWYC